MYIKRASDTTRDTKAEQFEVEQQKYVKDIAKFDHVTIYAKSELSYEQTSKEEELIDQLFRLFRAYNA